MSGDVVSDFLEPLSRLGFRPKAGEDLAEIAGHLARARPRATADDLRRAADIVAQRQTSRALPPVRYLVEAIDTVRCETTEADRRSAPARSAVAEAPIVTRCRRFVAAYEASDAAGRERIEADHPGRYEAALRVLSGETGR